MKNLTMKLIAATAVFLCSFLAFNTEAEAKVGQVLTQPQSSWARYDDRDALITYSGTYNNGGTTESAWVQYNNEKSCYKGTSTWSSVTGAKMTFYVDGSMFRIIGKIEGANKHFNTKNGVDVVVDGKAVGRYVEPKITSTLNQAVIYEYSFPQAGKHKVEIVCNNKVDPTNPTAMLFVDAVDVYGKMVNTTGYNTNLAPVLTVEQPTLNKTFESKFNITGYAMNSSGMKSVTAIFDNTITVNGTIGIKRSDAATLKTKYGSYPNYDTSGYSIGCNVNGLKLGMHRVVVRATGKNNVTTEKVMFLRVRPKANSTNKYVDVVTNKVPMYRYCDNRGDHFYTISPEAMVGGTSYGIENAGLPIGYMFAFQESGTVPLYRYYSHQYEDHFYTTDYKELGGGTGSYEYEGVECYVYKTQVSGSVPLYRYYNGKDHIYTVGKGELGEGKHGYTIENGGRPECYILSK